MSLSVMTCNLRVWTNSDGPNAWPYRRDGLSQLIRERNPLLLGTQEGLAPMLADLDERLPEYSRVGEGREGGSGGEYNALYYHESLGQPLEHGQFWLSDTPDVPGSVAWDSSLPRICTWAVFHIPWTRSTVAAFNCHFDHLGTQARSHSARLVWQRMHPCCTAGIPCILMGDFNCEPGSEPHRYLRQYLSDGLESSQISGIGTFHGFTGENSGGPIDWILASPGTVFSAVEILTQKQNGRYLSDHFPVWAEVQVQETKTPRFWDRNEGLR